MNAVIRVGTIKEVVDISKKIPEFENPHPEDEYTRRLNNKKYLILVACADGIPVGFKVAYDKLNDGSLYSWMGGVMPDFRRLHLARQLAEAQEEWAKKNGYTAVICKTRNKHKAMLLFAIQSGFQITGVEIREIIEEYRILLQKKLF